MKENIKKSAVDLTDLAIGIIVLGIVVSIGSVILIAARDSRLTELDTVSTLNESLTTVTETGENLASTWVSSINLCQNDSGTTIATGNYTTAISDFGTGSVAFSSASAADIANFNNTDWNCSYTWYNTSRPDWALANNASIGLGEYGNWFKIIVIVGVAAVVLSIIFMSFGRSTGTESVSY